MVIPERLVIIGGGFAGVRCARELKRLRKDAQIDLFARENHMVFQPLLADVAGSSLNPRAIAAPLRQLLPGVHCHNQEVVSLNPDSSTITIKRYSGETEQINFDQLVIAAGNKVNLGIVPGMLSYALPLKTVGDAIAMRAHVMERLEQAESSKDPEERRWLASFVVVGGGFSGVEVAGEINDLANHSLKYYPHIQPEDISITLVHSRDHILPEVSPPLQGFALKKMTQAGVHILLNERVARVNNTAVFTRDGTEIRAATIICTIGNTQTDLVEGLDVEKQKGRIVTDPDMRVSGTTNVWAIGDCAWVPNARDGEICPATAQFAERQGRQVAQNVHLAITGKDCKPFDYKPVGVACGIGGHKGVAELFGFRVSGFIAWWMWRSAFLMKLPSMIQKLKVGFEWAWEVVFPRELSYFSGSTTQPVATGYFSVGEVILESNSPSNSLYAIDKGECEIVYKGKVVSVMASEELFSTGMLQTYGDEDVLLRARTDVELIIIADDFLTQISAVLKPVQELLNRSQQVQVDLWQQLPAVKAMLEGKVVADIMRSRPKTNLFPNDTVIKAFAVLRESGERLALVYTKGDDVLCGIVTRTNLLNRLEQGTQTNVGECMVKNPTAVAQDDPVMVAINTMRDAGIKSVPVLDNQFNRHVVGLLHTDDIIAQVLAVPTE